MITFFKIYTSAGKKKKKKELRLHPKALVMIISKN